MNDPAQPPTDRRKFTLHPGVGLFALGAILSLFALVWWFGFYGSIAMQTGANVGAVFPCLFSTPARCEIIAAIASVTGQSPYTPGALWVGLALVALGVIVNTRKS